jgi:hypothetical protein
MPGRCSIAVVLIILGTGCARADAEVEALLRDIRGVAAQGAGSATARAAWEKLVGRGPAVLPRILEAMDTPDTVSANWLRSAFDHIVEVELKNGGQKIDVVALRGFVEDPRRQGRARRLALDVVERLKPGTRAALAPGWLEDPEFRYEAVESTLEQGQQLEKQGQKDRAVLAYRKAFTAARDVEQGRVLAARLKEHGSAVSVADHLGFLRDWYVIGPFDAKGMKGFGTVYPPEEKVDLAAELPGKGGNKLRWQRYHVREASAGLPARVALVNLLEPLGHAEDPVAYGYTAFTVPEAREVELRGAADDNLAVWVNGQRLFGFEEYRNGVRLDRHRFKAKLRPGVNSVLVKVCQAPTDPTNKEPNWEFLLRVVADASGKGLEIRSALKD